MDFVLDDLDWIAPHSRLGRGTEMLPRCEIKRGIVPWTSDGLPIALPLVQRCPAMRTQVIESETMRARPKQRDFFAVAFD